jgi:hypothetical protein
MNKLKLEPTPQRWVFHSSPNPTNSKFETLTKNNIANNSNNRSNTIELSNTILYKDYTIDT